MGSFSNPMLAIALPVALGILAVYLLLPQPRIIPRLVGIVFGIAALAFGGMFLLRESSAAHTVDAALFYAFSTLAIIGGVLLVTNPSPARGAISFALVVLSVCGLFLLQGAPFLMAGATIIYAGAIVVSFLFVIMLSQQHGPSDADARTREPLLACLAGGLFLAVLLGGIRNNYDPTGFDAVVAALDQSAKSDDKPSLATATSLTNGLPGGQAKARLLALFADFGLRLEKAATIEAAKEEFDKLRAQVARVRPTVGDLAVPGYLHMSAMSGRPANQNTTTTLPARNVAALGMSLFSDYILAVELAGTLLLVATIGAIAISFRIRRTAT